MDGRTALTTFVPPHQHASGLHHRYLEELMRLTYNYPFLMKNAVYLAGFTSLMVAVSPVAAPAAGLTFSLGATITATTVGSVSALIAGASSFAQHKLFGFPVLNQQAVYHVKQLTHASASGEIILHPGTLPTLRIQARESYDAGYVEGYLLGDAIKINLKNTNFLYPVMRVFLGAPKENTNLKKSLAGVLQTIPESYRNEMRGKVDGYNAWLQENHRGTEPLTFERYLLLQLLPDLRNYNPFSSTTSDVVPHMGCTAIAIRLGDYSFFTRVLDWPAYGDGGQYFLQVDRQIADAKRTIDIGFPLVSGAMTVLNQDDLLIEINVAHGNSVKKPQGMPAIFFNRYCAEQADSVASVARIAASKNPLGAYHLTTTDGKETASVHFYQNQQVPGDNETEKLDADTNSPQIMVVANHGVRFKNNKVTGFNYKDSDERKRNIHQFFKQPQLQDTLQGYITKQRDHQPLSPADILAIKNICLRIARLPVVNNCDSVLCAIYVYSNNQLLEACATTDNLHAQEHDLNDFQQLSIPSISRRMGALM